MDRKEFLKVCGVTCLGVIGVSALLQSCVGTHHVQGILNNNKIEINKAEFIHLKKGESSFRKYIIVRFDKSDFPVVVYRFSETDYKAMLLRCTHQGNELNVNGDLISCPAHNSEFTNKGEVLTGPADRSLETFPVIIEEKNIYIQVV